MPGYGFWLRSAFPGWGSWCVCVGLGFCCTLLFLVWVFGGVASCVRLVPFPPSSGGAACGVGWCGGCCGCGLSPPLPFFFFYFRAAQGLLFSALSCRGFVLSAAACPRLGPLGLSPPFPFRLGCVYVFFFFRWPATSRVGRVPACPGCPFLRWATVLGRVSPGSAGWSSGVLSGGPVGVAFLVAWLGGLPASCGVGAGLRGCVSASCPPPFICRRAHVRGWGGLPPFCAVCFFLFFWRGVCLFLPLPSLGWCTHWSAFGVANRVAVRAALGWAVPWPPGSGGLCTRLAWWPILSGQVLALPPGRLSQAVL